MPLWRRTFGTALTLSRPSQRHRHPVQTVSGRKYPRTAARRPVSAMGQIAETPTARHDRLTGRRSPRMAERAAALASALAARLSLAISLFNPVRAYPSSTSTMKTAAGTPVDIASAFSR
jgi:hypothetical protein